MSRWIDLLVPGVLTVAVLTALAGRLHEEPFASDARQIAAGAPALKAERPASAKPEIAPQIAPEITPRTAIVLPKLETLAPVVVSKAPPDGARPLPEIEAAPERGIITGSVPEKAPRTLPEPEKIVKTEPEGCVSALNARVSKDSIRFGQGSAHIDGTSAPLLNELAAIAAKCPKVRFEISGHADGDGPGFINEELSTARALAVAAYLVAVGVNPRRLESMGYGELRPLAANDTPEGKASNRRIEFRFIE